MQHKSMDDRADALEDLFFAKREQQLIERHRRERAQAEQRDQLIAASGISDPAVIDSLIAQGMRAETLLALSLFPLVAVAWADDSLDPKERDAVRKAATSSGISEGSDSLALLDQWLAEKPAPEVFAAWRDYTQALARSLAPGAREQLRREIIGRARRVAQAAGGVLGLMAITAAEETALAKLSAAFD